MPKLTDAEKAELALSLCERLKGSIDKRVEEIRGVTKDSVRMFEAGHLLNSLTWTLSCFPPVTHDGECDPPGTWWREIFLLDGDHMILTYEGWFPGLHKARYLAEDPNWKPLDEVNAPEAT